MLDGRTMMKSRLKIVSLLILLIGAGWFAWPRKADMRGFNPDAMARMEANAWRHYYEKKWFAMFTDLYGGARHQYGFSPCDSVLISLHAARAAKIFQPSRSREEAWLAIPPLESYFSVIKGRARLPLDVHEAARTELEWWQLRREGRTWLQYGHAIAIATGVVYSLPSEQFEAASLKRAEMMNARDNQKNSITEEDWRRIEEGLRTAWHQIKNAVTPPR